MEWLFCFLKLIWGKLSPILYFLKIETFAQLHEIFLNAKFYL